jgi:hypothetical protein
VGVDRVIGFVGVAQLEGVVEVLRHGAHVTNRPRRDRQDPVVTHAGSTVGTGPSIWQHRSPGAQHVAPQHIWLPVHVWRFSHGRGLQTPPSQYGVGDWHTSPHRTQFSLSATDAPVWRLCLAPRRFATVAVVGSFKPSPSPTDSAGTANA